MSARLALSELNALDMRGFVEVCGGLFERSPWIAERVWPRRPFASLKELHRELVAVVEAATEREKLGLISAHPDLAGSLARGEPLSGESRAEQAAAGFTGLAPDASALLARYNADYRAKFGFPFVICARENRAEAVLAAFPLRLANNLEEETATALAEIAKIARLRLQDAVGEE